jgi:hypothetical protein
VTGAGPAARPGWDGRDDAVQCAEAARLREEHPGWLVVWIPHDRVYRAYRMQGRKEEILTAGEPGELAELIREAGPALPRRGASPRPT